MLSVKFESVRGSQWRAVRFVWLVALRAACAAAGFMFFLSCAAPTGQNAMSCHFLAICICLNELWWSAMLCAASSLSCGLRWRDPSSLHPTCHAWCSNSGWMGSSSYCNWYGVSCNGAGDPESIILRNNGLKGNIPPEIGYLNASLKFLCVPLLRTLWNACVCTVNWPRAMRL